MAEKNQVKTLEKCVHVLTCMADNLEPMTLNELIKKTGLKKTTTYRLLQALTSLQLMEKNPETKQYHLGPKLIYFGVTALGNLDLHKISLPIMTKLRNDTGETINLSILKGSEIIILARIRSDHLFNVNLSVGSRLPVNCTSQGKVILAYMNDDRANEIMENFIFEKKTEKTIVSMSALKNELELVREKGYAVNDEELEKGLSAVAAPIFNYAGEVIAAINVSYSTARHPEPEMYKRFSKKVITASKKISKSIGFSG
ncbi:IclR family transcriptional regulator [Desulfobacula sp.]|uniref:IclR family transcriptional regulator n=1 Tax=Desulfobacula sp. TaxID=2593537 RepID=UPI0026053BB2|nr:IclR family transcriptional regulator [Desulfobacula sp.]